MVIVTTMLMLMMVMIPIEVTLVGIVTDVSEVHEAKTASPNRIFRVRVIINIDFDTIMMIPIVVTLVGIVIDASTAHP